MKLFNKILFTLISLFVFTASAFSETVADLSTSGRASFVARSGNALTIGTAGTDRLNFIVNNTVKGYFDSTGLTGATFVSPTISGNLILATAPGLIASSVNTSLTQLTGGTVASSSASARISLYGSAEASVPGNVYINTGTANTASKIILQLLGTSSSLEVNNAGGTNLFNINQAGAIFVGTGATRSFITGGMDGRFSIDGAAVSTGSINLSLNHASALFRIYNSSGSAMWNFADTGTITQNGSSGGNIILNKDDTGIFAGTSDAADNIDLVIAGGGAATASRGGTILVAGNEGSGAGAVQLYGGNTATANINFVTNNASAKIQFFNASTVLKWSMDNNGLFTTPTAFGNDIGWTPVNAANQACNTTCATGCVFGMNTGALGNFVGCADATADTCICAGAS